MRLSISIPFILLFAVVSVGAQSVKLTEVTWHGAGCYKIEMPMGTVYFEKDNGVSGFKSFIDPDGHDWIASYLPPGPNGDFRGFPNGVGNFGHAGRDSGSSTIIVGGRTEGDHVVLESSNADFTFQYWFFPDRVAIKVLKSKGDYCFLLECVAGGSADADDYFVTADGERHVPQGEFADFTPEWIYLGDPKVNHTLFFAKAPDDDAPNENHRQIRPSGAHNMDLYSFGRTGKEQNYEIRGMSGNDHVCVIGFAPADRPHEQMARMIEGFLNAPFGDAKLSERVDYNVRIGSSGAVPEYPVFYDVPTVESVKTVIDRIGHYVIENTSLHVFDNKTGVEITDADLAHPNPDAVIDGRFAHYNHWDYPNGVTWSAFHRISDITGDQSYTKQAVRVYDWIFTWAPYFREQEKLTGKSNAFSKMHDMRALDHCGAITAGLIRTHLRAPDPRFRHWADVVADYISNGQFRLPDCTLARERPQDVSVWADDFYMGISFLAQMGRLTGDGKYWDDAIKQVTQGSARLFDDAKCLYDHGWSENTAGYDPRFYWGRGNGWSALAMTELLAELPADYPGRDQVLHYYRQLMRGVVEQQDGTGLWHNVLNRHETYLETSASAMFVYALARGVNEGWLSPIFGPPVITGWNGLVTRVLPDGRVEGICEGTTYASEFTYYTYRGAGSDTIFVGPVLYAGAEVIRLLQNPALQISEPRSNAVNSALLMKEKD